MADVDQLKTRIREAVSAGQEQRVEFERALEEQRLKLQALQQCIAQWIEALEIDDVSVSDNKVTLTFEQFDDTYQLELNEQIVSFGVCELHVRPDEQYFTSQRVLMYVSSDEEDVKEIVESEGAYYFANLQYGQKRHLAHYDSLTEEGFYKQLYAWLKV